MIIKKKNPFIEGRSDKNFRVVNLFTGSIFAIIFSQNPHVLACTLRFFDQIIAKNHPKTERSR